MVASDSMRQVTLAELVATLSLLADLGMGRPMERVLRQTVIAMRLGTAAGMDQAARTSAYYTSLLTWVGCAVDTSEMASLFGDETEFYADTRDEDLGGVSLALFVARHLGRGKSGFRRIGMVGKFLATAGHSVQQVMQSHCREASDLADGLELGPAVREPLLQAFERWDGKRVPGSAGGDGLAPAIRLVHLADSVEAFHHTGGAELVSPVPAVAGQAPGRTARCRLVHRRAAGLRRHRRQRPHRQARPALHRLPGRAQQLSSRRLVSSRRYLPRPRRCRWPGTRSLNRRSQTSDC